MSAVITTGQDLIASAKFPGQAPLFTTFDAGHFVKPAAAVQPVAVKPFSYSEVFVAVPLDLDYDEPNAVVEQEMELVVAGESVHHVQVQVQSSKPVSRREIAPRIAA